MFLHTSNLFLVKVTNGIYFSMNPNLILQIFKIHQFNNIDFTGITN